MNMTASFTNIRSSVAYRFSSLRNKALRSRLANKLTGTNGSLDVFPGNRSRVSPSRKLLGVENIRVDQIIGTLNRSADFDSQFRPLKKHNVDRWINIYILFEQDGWPPIIVHKVGDDYFVEDGHHRISVARSIGIDFIEAKVWEYDVQKAPTSIDIELCCTSDCTEQNPVEAYATG